MVQATQIALFGLQVIMAGLYDMKANKSLYFLMNEPARTFSSSYF